MGRRFGSTWERSATVAGGIAGLLVWLPAPDVAAVCPPPGEGRTQCVLNEVWVAGLLHVLLGALLAALIVGAVRGWPAFRAARRDWMRRQAAPAPPDPDLPAARWEDMERWTRDEPRAAAAEPLPVGDDGRLAADDLRAWLAATGAEAPGPR